MDNLVDSFEFVSLALDSNKKPLLFIDLYVQNSPAEPLRTLIDSGATSNFISPSVVEKLKIPKTQLKNPQVVRMLDGTISQTGRIWHQVHLTVLANGHSHSIPFLVCPIGNTPAILGMTWLTAEAPLIDWQQGLVTFPECRTLGYTAPTIPTSPNITSRTPSRASSRASQRTASHQGRSYPHEMATRSWSSARPQSPLDQGELGPTLPATAVESASLEPKVYGEVSLSRAISLILGLQNQVLRLEQELEETKEAAKEAQDWMGAVDQALTRIEARGGAPHTPEDRKPPAVKATPRPLPKTNTFPAPSAPLVAWANPTKAPPAFAQPTPVRAPPRGYTPPPPSPIRLLKVDHPDAYTGKIGNEARQWLTRMLAWVRLNQRMFPTDQETLSFLLMNMKDVAGAWAHPHLDQLGSHRALIQSVDDFRVEFLAAFGNPDATQAAERQITQLTQTGTCAEYITKFRTISMDLDWNDATLRGQFARGLHWEVSRLIATRERRPTTLLELQNAALVIDNALREERASHPPKGNKSGASTTTPNRGASTGQQATRPGRLSSDPNFVSEEERNRRRAEGLCIKCGKAGHKFAECRTGWKATPKEEAVKKEAAKIGKESGPESGKD
ncbi:Retrotransposable element Tf2 protein [Rhizoctonia solani]|uniref:Retrotransposable element Tf2 protein n=1 Tax=Rhizoctonia solani TaxID=456999 RepID=A0A8H8NUP0_9AGAM|nr:Retrotransposable element Tf2 protein [Rhizoctonia solani]QRW20386.1 Retrotransposable element Tf2 protein [Rhizoctonia solani]